MSHLRYFTYPGFGERVQKDTHYSQAVRIGDVIKISGQCKTVSSKWFLCRKLTVV